MAHCLPVHRQGNGGGQTRTNIPADVFAFCLGVSCALEGRDFCWRFLPAHKAARCLPQPQLPAALCRTELEPVFISEALPEAREFTSDSELPQSLRTCRSSSQPPSQIHIQCNLDPIPASPFFGKPLNSGLNYVPRLLHTAATGF